MHEAPIPQQVAQVDEAAPGQASSAALASESALDLAAPEESNEAAEPEAAIEPGAWLLAIRESTGLSREEFARKARIPTAVLIDLEAGRFARLGALVYVRGYVRSFARAAGVDDASILQAVERVAAHEAPSLVVARVEPPAPRWLLRYATPVAYALLTGVVLVPLVYLARPTGGAVQVPTLTAIDAPATLAVPARQVASASVLGSDMGPPAPVDETTIDEVRAPAPLTPAESAEPAAEPDSPRPVMASLAPMPERVEMGRAQRVVLRLREASWVEFTGSDGTRLEYSLLPAGTTREYQLLGSAELRIGNSGGAELTLDGRSIDLVAASRANVARVVLGGGTTDALH
jgi:cytoskeleton protein RodZ